ncbi:hypothetical protein [Bacteroides sp. 51]|uniref:hypothetical protein n=1 Tax=Bacteroides sp. 51 TaxID=2302938 RepID=UPI0013D58712|nr:hypothetical protein [Bacteroides sp. 51]NDV84181.1 hypothetical protein [Bacteroides sp. 51]
MKRLFILLVAVLSMSTVALADDGSGKVQVGIGLLYENGMDMTVGYEYETRYHNAWEFFGNAYLKWEDCLSCGHICPDSFWKSYNTWGVGAAYKPCVVRGRNNYGNLRLGGSLGSDRHDILGGIHIGYEHSYSLRKGWQLFWQVKSDVMIEGKDLLRTGIVIGIKIPTR